VCSGGLIKSCHLPTSTLTNSASSVCTCIEVNMADTSYVGLHLFCKMSRHMLPSAYTVLERGGGVKHTEKWMWSASMHMYMYIYIRGDSIFHLLTYTHTPPTPLPHCTPHLRTTHTQTHTHTQTRMHTHTHTQRGLKAHQCTALQNRVLVQQT